jgi:hypothetical protein
VTHTLGDEEFPDDHPYRDGDTDDVKDLPTEMASAIADHDYFVIIGVTDVDKMRDEARRRQQGDYYAKTESSVIHHHKFDEHCDQDPKKHEVWLRKEEGR